MNDAPDLYAWLAEIDQKAELFVGRPQGVQALRLVNIIQHLDGLELNQH
jgi:hypothetical protein